MALASRALAFAALAAVLAGCHARGAVEAGASSDAAQPPRFDHLVLFVDDDALQTCLAEVFTPAELLATRHPGQGTSGSYFLFLNTFVELLKLEDLDEARANQVAFGSDYTLRWTDAGSPFAVGVVVASLDPSQAGFRAQLYAAPDGRSTYLMAKGNEDAQAPLVYATGPERAHPRRRSLDEVDAIEDPKKRETVRAYLTHPSGALAVTRVVMRLPAEALDSTNAELARGLEFVEFAPASNQAPSPHLLLEFDGGAQGRVHTCDGPPGVTLRW